MLRPVRIESGVLWESILRVGKKGVGRLMKKNQRTGGVEENMTKKWLVERYGDRKQEVRGGFVGTYEEAVRNRLLMRF